MTTRPYPFMEIAFDKNRLFDAAVLFVQGLPLPPGSGGAELTDENRPLFEPLLLRAAAETHRILGHLDAVLDDTPAAFVLGLTPSSGWQRDHLPALAEHYLVTAAAEAWLRHAAAYRGDETAAARNALRSAALAVDTPVHRPHSIPNR